MSWSATCHCCNNPSELCLCKVREVTALERYQRAKFQLGYAKAAVKSAEQDLRKLGFTI